MGTKDIKLTKNGRNATPLVLQIIKADANGSVSYDEKGNIKSENQIVAYGEQKEFDRQIKQLPTFGYNVIRIASKEGLLRNKDGAVGDEYYKPIIEEVNKFGKKKMSNEEKLIAKLEKAEKANKEMLERLEALESKGGKAKKSDDSAL